MTTSDQLIVTTAADFEDAEADQIRKLSLRIQFAAAAMASSFILLNVPNIETITFSVFIVGYLFPRKYALSITLTTVIGWELLVTSVFGFSGITFFFKLVAWCLITLLASFARAVGVNKSYQFAVLGFFSALLFDFLVTISIAILFINSEKTFLTILLTYLILGLLFTIIHVIGNTILFAMIPQFLEVILPLLLRSYPNVTQISLTQLQSKSTNRRIYLVSFLLMIMILVAGFFVYEGLIDIDNEDVIEVSIVMRIDYNGIQPSEVYNLDVLNNQSVFFITQQIAQIQYTIYFDLPLVASINGVSQNNNAYWKISVNGNEATVGAGSLYPAQNDVFDWEYTEL